MDPAILILAFPLLLLCSTAGIFKFTKWGMQKKKPGEEDTGLTEMGLAAVGVACVVTGPVGWMTGAGLIGAALAWDLLAVTCETVGKKRSQSKEPKPVPAPKKAIISVPDPPPVVTREQLLAELEQRYRQKVAAIRCLSVAQDEREDLLRRG